MQFSLQVLFIFLTCPYKRLSTEYYIKNVLGKEGSILFEVYDIAIIPLILGVVELFKRGGLPVKYSPFVAVGVGLLFGLLYLDTEIKQRIIIGLMLGLSATGLYSGSKNITQKKE